MAKAKDEMIVTINGATVNMTHDAENGTSIGYNGGYIVLVMDTARRYAKEPEARRDGSLSAPSYVVSTHSWKAVQGTAWKISANARAVRSDLDGKAAAAKSAHLDTDALLAKLANRLTPEQIAALLNE